MSRGAQRALANLQRGPETVSGDRECLECGYLLRGLKIGGACPECGAEIEPSLYSDDPLSRMPWRVIRLFLFGSWLATLCFVGAIGVSWLGFFDKVSWDVVRYLQLGFIVPAVGAVWLMTPAFRFPEAASRGFTTRSRLRSVARWGQLGWLMVVGSMVVQDFVSTTAVVARDTLNMAMVLGTVVGVVGLIALAEMMQRLAEWVRDDMAQRMFQWFQWLLPPGLLIAWLMGRSSLLGALFTMVVMVGAGLLPIGVLLLTKSISFTAQHRAEFDAREDRRTERARRDAARVDARLNGIDKTGSTR